MPQVSLSELVAGARLGKALVSFPTDTVPALAARPDQSSLIYQAKQRSQDKPLILMGATLEELLPYVTGTDEEIAVWRQVTEQHWPGALTLVLPTSPKAPPEMNPQQTGTLGIRVPDHPLARYILAQTGPLATTSANRSGQPPLQTVSEIAEQFPEVLILSPQALEELKRVVEIPAAINQQPSGSGLPSTVARWTGQAWEILRQGAIHL
ncbi:MAG TPA: L-threonylcarbamoyladenylate synthase [Leptolyngbyaceae cyanobacterium]